MLLKNAKLYKEEGLRDITLQSGQIQSIKPAGNISETADETVIDLEGKLVLPLM
ncbi:hypothetical protein [Lentibacillus amyloliquefaciens]|uniref:hypothetical protein n=1 Tax=Lentibacillus amyloliquefaciens TaxID=1472767 RepID=UPI001F19D5AE|nr:hypothetical protein [Lentibacillus amyloliquefaciens]